MAISEARKRMNQDFLRLIKEGVWACLRAHGFVHKGTDHWRGMGTGVIHRVLFYRVGWSQPPDGTRFYIQCSVHVPAYRELFPDHVGITMDHDVPPQVSIRPEDLCGEQIEVPYVLPDGITHTDLAAMSERFTEILERFVLPWIAQFRTPIEVGHFLSSTTKAPGHYVIGYREIGQTPSDLRNAAIAYFAAGEYHLARHVLDLAMATIDRHGKGHTADLRQRMDRLIAQRLADRAKP